MLTSIRNAKIRGKVTIQTPSPKQKLAIATLLKQ